MDRKAYTECMTPHMTGTGKTREERQQSMCIGAKLCTGRAKDREEAAKLCAEAAANPKPATKTGTRSRKCEIDAPTLAACVIDGMAGKEISVANLTPVLTGCTGQKVVKPPTEKSFLRKCIKTNQVTGKMGEMQGIVNKCRLEWKAKEAPVEQG